MEENKIEQYLIDLMLSYREVEPNLWLIDDTEHDITGIVVMHMEPLVIVRTLVMEAPSGDKRLECFAKLLELNATDVLHGAYGLDGNQIVLMDTLEYDTMDYSEFRATLDAFSLALSQHYPILSNFRD
jgi:hypothetical protein